MTEQVGFHIKAESSGISAAKEELEKLTLSGDRAERATDGLKNTINQLTANSSKSKVELKGFNQILEEGRKGPQGLKKALGDAWKKSEDANKSLYRLSKTVKSIPDAPPIASNINKIKPSADAANDSMKRMRFIAGGLGYQLQDVAVQAQSGTSAFTILGQQGSQIASVFGPSGIVAGAMIAIGSAIVGTALKVGDTGKELKELEENALQLNDAFGITSGGALAYNERLQRLATTAPGVADAIFRIKKAQLELEQTLTEGALRDSLGDFESLTTLLESRTTQSFEESKTSALFLKSSLANLTDEFGGTTQQVIAVSRALEDFNEEGNKDTAAGLVHALGQLKGGSTDTRKELTKLVAILAQYVETSEILASSEDPFEDQSKSVRSLVDSLSLEAATLGKTNRERDLYIAKQGKATEAQYDAINAAYDQIEAEQSASVIEKLQQRLLSEEEKIDESYMRRREIIMANTVEGSEQQNELLRENWDAYEAEYGEHQARLDAQDKLTADRREKAEKQVSKSIIRQKEGVVNSGIALLKNLAAGNEKAAKVMLAIQAGMNVAMVMQNTAAAIMGVQAAYSAIPGSEAFVKARQAEIQSLGNIQAGIVAANGALQLGGGGGGGGGGSSSSFSGGSSANPYQAPPTTQTLTEDTRQPVHINFYGDVNGTDPEHLVNVIRDHLEETDALLVTVNSRNGQELRGAF